MRRGWVGALALCVLVLGACSGGEIAEEVIENQEGVQDVDIDEDSGEINIDTDDGSATFGGGEIPDGFPIDVPDGGEVQAVIESDGGASVTIVYPGGYDDIVAFYESWVNDSGMEVANRTESSNPSVVDWILTTGDGGGAQISVADVGDGSVNVTLITS